MRKLGKCLLSIQQDERASARPLLNLWVAEAIALICCVRVYNPEFLKAIDSAAMNGSAAVRPSHCLLVQHLVSVCTLTFAVSFRFGFTVASLQFTAEALMSQPVWLSPMRMCMCQPCSQAQQHLLIACTCTASLDG